MHTNIHMCLLALVSSTSSKIPKCWTQICSYFKPKGRFVTWSLIFIHECTTVKDISVCCKPKYVPITIHMLGIHAAMQASINVFDEIWITDHHTSMQCMSAPFWALVKFLLAQSLHNIITLVKLTVALPSLMNRINWSSTSSFITAQDT